MHCRLMGDDDGTQTAVSEVTLWLRGRLRIGELDSEGTAARRAAKGALLWPEGRFECWQLARVKYGLEGWELGWLMGCGEGRLDDWQLERLDAKREDGWLEGWQEGLAVGRSLERLEGYDDRQVSNWVALKTGWRII
jgi:hypothetical protein